MNKVKPVFMQFAPVFVIDVGISTLLFLLLGSILICFTGNLVFGIFLILWISAGLGVIFHAIYRCEKCYGKSLNEIIADIAKRDRN